MSLFNLPSATDASVNVLIQMFGQPIYDILEPSSTSTPAVNLITEFLASFSNTLATSFLFIYAIILVIGTINTAHEGKFLGKQWSSIWVPVRAIVGPIAIMPINGGFCAIQYALMYFILLGVNLANTVWQSSIGDINAGNVPTIPSSLYTAVNNQLALGFMYSSVDAMFCSTGATGQFNCAVNVSGNNYFNSGTMNGPVETAVNNEIETLCNTTIGPVPPPPAQPTYLFSAPGTCTSILQGGWETKIPASSAFPGYAASGSTGDVYYVEYGSNYNSGNWTSPNGGGYPPVQANSSGFAGIGFPNGMFTSGGGATYNLGFNPQPSPYTGPSIFVNTTPTVSKTGPSLTVSGIPLTPQGLEQYLNSNTGDAGTNTKPGSGAGLGGYMANWLGGMNGVAQSPNSTTQQPFPACTSTSQCGLGSLTNSVVAGLISNEPSCPSATLNNDTIPGTGNTCQWTCRDATTYQPLSSDYNAVPNSSYVNNSCPNTNPGAPVTYTASTGPYTCVATVPNPTDANWVATQSCFEAPADGSTNYTYIAPVTFNSSWWYGGMSYLTIAQNMANNLNALAQQVSNLAMAPVNAPTVNLSQTVNSIYVTVGELDCTQGAPNCPYASGTGPQSSQVTISTIPGSSVNLVGNMIWADAVNYIFFGSSYLISSAAPEPSSDNSSSTSDIPASNLNSLTSVLQSQYPYQYQFYQSLMSLPLIFRTPIEVIAALNQQTGIYQPGSMQGCAMISNTEQIDPAQATATCQYYISSIPGTSAPGLVPYIENIMGVLMTNGVINNVLTGTASAANSANVGTDTSYMGDPIQSMMSDIFGGLLGGGLVGAGGGGGGATAGNITSIMEQIYSLGDAPVPTATSNDAAAVANAQFDLVTQAENIGIGLMTTVMNSITTIVQQYQTVSEVEAGVLGGTAAVGSAAAIAAGAIPMSSLSSALIGATQLFFQIGTLAAMMDMSMHLIWLPLAIMVMTCLFTAGVGFAIMLPLIPYILFWAGQIAWILAIIEAMVAAPIILLGIAHPGGHDVLGHATPALKMLLGIIFRPALMVLGLLVGMVLTFIVISFSAQGFHVVGSVILGIDGPGANLVMNSNVQGIIASIMVMVYVAFLMMAFNKCFSTIYVLPEKVMQWIGAHGEKAGVEDLQKMEGAVNQTSQQVTQAGGSSVQAKTSADKDMVQGGSSSGEKAGGGAGKLRADQKGAWSKKTAGSSGASGQKGEKGDSGSSGSSGKDGDKGGGGDVQV